MEEKYIKNKFEPTISDLEWLIFEFRKNNGEAELSVLLNEILGDLKPEKNEEIKKGQLNNSFFEGLNQTEENFIDEIKYKFTNFSWKKQETKSLNKNDNLNNALKGIKKFLQNKYVKKAYIFAGLYFFIYLLISSPMHYERIKFALAKTEKVKVMTEEVIKTPMADSAPLESGETIPQGTHLQIPKIGTNAPIIFANSREESAIQNDLKKGVVKYNGTANPGQIGNTFIVGHSSGFFWDNSQYKFVFTLLDKLETGDKAKIYHNNKKFEYQVIEKKIIEPTDVSVLKKNDEPYLTLMTCYPPGTTSKRLIVKMKQISPEYIKPKVVMKEKEIEVPKTLPASDNRTILDRLIFFWR